VSDGERIDATLQHYRRTGHPDVLGRANKYPYHGHLSDIEEESPWTEKTDDDTVILTNVEPQPWYHGRQDQRKKEDDEWNRAVRKHRW
jgi:hypothetical protein